jgi:hypothetical protein
MNIMYTFTGYLVIKTHVFGSCLKGTLGIQKC